MKDKEKKMKESSMIMMEIMIAKMMITIMKSFQILMEIIVFFFCAVNRMINAVTGGSSVSGIVPQVY